MPETRSYRYVLDNAGNICVDNSDNLIYIDYIIIITSAGVEVRRVKGKTYPCIKCKYYHSMRFPDTSVHREQQRGLQYLPNLKAGCDQPYVTIIGECPDYQAKT